MNTKYPPLTKEQIHNFKKDLLEEMVYSLLQNQQEMNQQLALLTEQLNVMNQQRFGRHTEKSSQIEHQMEFCFNEAEVTFEDSTPDERIEPEITDIFPDQSETAGEKKKRKPRQKGQRENNLKELPHQEIVYELKADERQCGCGGTYTELSTEKSTRLIFHPACFEVAEEIVHVYKCNKCGTIIRADHPMPLFEGSVATPSLLAGIMMAKYVNAMPFYRLEKTFADSGAMISRQTMARWMINAVDSYLIRIYERMKELLLESRIIHADETTVEVSKDGRKAGAKSYMWVYVNENDDCPTVIYEYQKTRAAVHPRTFLADYKGILCCDGYEAYHTLNSEITVCGCWAHARRHFSNAVKALKNDKNRRGELTTSQQALKMIADLFQQDKEWNQLSPDERMNNRQTILQPKVNAFMSWLESKEGTIPPKSETGKGITYCINQRKYLLGFLATPDAPLDNSEAERKIRNFVISRKNFIMIDTISGAEASAVLFSLAETAKANHLKPYNYFEYLLTELPRYPEEFDIDDLLPWSKTLPAEIHKQEK